MNAAAPLPDGYVAHLPPLKHKFDGHLWVSAAKSHSGFAQTERVCTVCGAVKVTVHGPGDHHGRAWRKDAHAPQVESFDAPVCVPSVATKEGAASEGK